MFESLTPLQREIVFKKKGEVVVRACPGSGKTYCVSARLTHLISNWERKYEGIAAISFTNVAWQEIDKTYKFNTNNSKGISFPHFIGTIDSFINRYIFLPYGHLVLKCKQRPTLVGEPHGSWAGRYFSESFFDNLSYTLTGELYAINARRMPANWTSNKQIPKAKNNLIKAGYANQSDANYFSMRLLEQFPQIAQSLVLRFPYLIVDEAQDTSDIQMRIIDLLVENGLKEVMLVGDPDQAIFEWNEAKPELLNEKFSKWEKIGRAHV